MDTKENCWTEIPPTEQGFYWHWNKDQDSAPFPLHVLRSGTTETCFVSMGQSGIQHPIDCDKFGGLWLKIEEPCMPSALSNVRYPSLNSGLNLTVLRGANRARLPQFKNARGEAAHSDPNGFDWSLCDWMTAFTGEVGEAANIVKKIRRGDITLAEARPALKKEIADCLTYLDLLAFNAGIDLSAATVEKFNEISRRVGSPVRLRMDRYEV